MLSNHVIDSSYTASPIVWSLLGFPFDGLEIYFNMIFRGYISLHYCYFFIRTKRFVDVILDSEEMLQEFLGENKMWWEGWRHVNYTVGKKDNNCYGHMKICTQSWNLTS